MYNFWLAVTLLRARVHHVTKLSDHAEFLHLFIASTTWTLRYNTFTVREKLWHYVEKYSNRCYVHVFKQKSNAYEKRCICFTMHYQLVFFHVLKQTNKFFKGVRKICYYTECVEVPKRNILTLDWDTSRESLYVTSIYLHIHEM